MAWLPISLTVPQYMNGSSPYSGAVLKAYQSGTSTNIPFATDSVGGTQVTSIALNADGFPEVSGNIVIPHIDQSFKLSLYPTQTAADANSGADWTIDGLTPISNVAFGNTVNEQTANYTLQAEDKGALIYFSGAGGVTLDLLSVAAAGEDFSFAVENDTSGTVTLDGDGSEQVNGATTFVITAGQSAIVFCTGTAWRAIGTISSKTIVDPTIKGTAILSGAPIEFAEGAAVTSAATTNIWSGDDGNTVHITGSTGPITSFGTAPQAGAFRFVIFDSTPTLTHGANLNLNNGGSDIAAEAGDIALVYADTTTQMDVFFIRASGRSVSATSVEVFTSSGTFTAKRSGNHVVFIAAGGGGGGGGGGGTAAGGGGGGGGGGGESRWLELSLTKGTGYTVTVGAAGTGGASVAAGTAGNAGTNGGQSAFDSSTAAGGVGGGAGNAAGVGGAGGSTTVASGGTGGVAGGDVTSRTSSAGGAGGGNGGGTTGGGGGGGGSSFDGVGGAGGNGGSTGGAGTAGTTATRRSAGGGGGGGGSNNAIGEAGGDGASGRVIVFW